MPHDSHGFWIPFIHGPHNAASDDVRIDFNKRLDSRKRRRALVNEVWSEIHGYELIANDVDSLFLKGLCEMVKVIKKVARKLGQLLACDEAI